MSIIKTEVEFTKMIMDFAIYNMGEYVKHLRDGRRNPYVCNFGLPSHREITTRCAKIFAKYLTDDTNGAAMTVIYVCRSGEEFLLTAKAFSRNKRVKVVLGRLFEDDKNCLVGVDLDYTVIIMDNSDIPVQCVIDAVYERGYNAAPMIIAFGENV